MAGGRQTPQVSVIVPTRNRARVLPRTLDSALAQQDVRLEIVVVDDASTDGTREYLEDHPDPRVRPFRNERNLGVSGARNRAIAEARGEWVAFLDDDDLWAPAKLGKQLIVARLEEADYVYTTYIAVDEGVRPVVVEGSVPPSEVPDKLRLHNAIGPPSSMIAKRALLDRTGGFDEQLSYIADWELWIRFAEIGKGALVPEPLMGYVQHADSMLLQRRYDIYAELEYLQAKHPQLDVDMALWSRWLASGPRRAGKRFQAARVYWEGAIAQRNFGNVVRAIGMLLGERITRAGRALITPGPVHEPEWLEPYRRG